MKREAVSCIIFHPGLEEILLIKRRDIPVWVLPGGGIEPGETSIEAAKREAQEETGFEVTVVRQIAKYRPLNGFTQTTHFFECSIIGGTATTGYETKEVSFFPLTALPKLLPTFYRYWILDALENAPTILEKPIQGTSYFMFIKYLFSHPILVMRFLLTKIGIHLNS